MTYIRQTQCATKHATQLPIPTLQHLEKPVIPKLRLDLIPKEIRDGTQEESQGQQYDISQLFSSTMSVLHTGISNCANNKGVRILAGRIAYTYGAYQLHTFLSSVIPQVTLGASEILISVTNISAFFVIGSKLLFKV